MDEKKLNVLGLAVFAVVCALLSLITVALFRTVGKGLGMLFLASALFVVAWMAEMLTPEQVLMHAVMYISGIGLFVSSLMTAIFPYVMVSAIMYALLALSLVQIILCPAPFRDES